jgi:hypothetical protein
VCHSEVEQFLQELDTDANLFIPSKAGSTLPSYGGRSLITDDQCKCDTADSKTTAVIYLFGAGAIAYNDCPGPKVFEAGRNILKSQDFVVTRSSDIMHVRGVKWTGTNYATATYGGTGANKDKQPTTPRNVDLQNAGNWQLVYPKEYVRCVKVIARID